MPASGENKPKIQQMEDLLVSVRAVAARKGDSTAWERLDKSIADLGIGSVTARTYRVLPSDVEYRDCHDESH